MVLLVLVMLLDFRLCRFDTSLLLPFVIIVEVIGATVVDDEGRLAMLLVNGQLSTKKSTGS